MHYICCTDTRRNAVLLHPSINGIDFLEVLDNETDPYQERQTTLFLHFIKPLVPVTLDSTNIVIEGGERIRNIKVISVTLEGEASFPASPPEEEEKVLVVKVSEAGDFSTYTLKLVGSSGDTPPDGFDPVLSSVAFSFKVLCPVEFDCKSPCGCPPEEAAATPQINYLAKDYATFRQLMLDRMALLVPQWKERNPADLGVALVELLAYSADYLSYRQDAIATEAYLGTARKRISVRRHARLVDYFMHDGCNARAWLHIQAGPGVHGLLLERGAGNHKTRVLTRVRGLPAAFRLHSPEYGKALKAGATVFELMHDLTLYALHNEMQFYTWCGKICCLPKGATQATLKGSFPHLKPGDVLVFTEVLGPETGVPEDADPAHRHAVRLVEVTPASDLACDAVPGSPDSPPVSLPVAVTEIRWHKADALPFPLCISGRKGIDNISIALGNIVLADHGFTMEDEAQSSLSPDEVPGPAMAYAGIASDCCDFCKQTAPESPPARFRPRLLSGPLTCAAPFDPDNRPASAGAHLQWSMRTPMPVITLRETGEEGDIKGGQEWFPKRDLLNSASIAKEFVVETESDGTAFLRFGNDKQGASPAAEIKFMAAYRLGNGTGGNIGAGSLAHLATNDPAIIAGMEQQSAVWNPLSAKGGMDAETIEEVKQYAPEAFRVQERAVNAQDYEDFARRCSTEVQRAATTFRWTGSWKTVFLTVDRLGGQEVDALFEKDLRSCLERFRMAGFDLEVDAPLYVSLEIEMAICVHPDFFGSDVKRALLEVFSSRTLPNGRRGLFHPDNFSFGQTVYLSPLYAAAQAIQGVESVKVTKFRRQGSADNNALLNGKLLLERREIARLDNDPNFPEHGSLNLIMKGGRS